ncbi:MAG: Rrf2 family transcriptional regulator [Proteobacteria bacterium]|nr:Rrf2 family transcriptional regulator [Pseudomonadota bacterium]
MHLSTRGRYAIMAMLDLAQLAAANRHAGVQKPVTLAMIAERQQISLSYLEQLFAKLRKANVVGSTRGPGGGYVIPRNLHEITLAEIVDAVDEVIDVTRCGDMHNPHGPKKGHGCVYGAKCNAHDLWTSLGKHIEGFMQQTTLQMVLDGKLPGLTGTAAVPAASGIRVHIRS